MIKIINGIEGYEVVWEEQNSTDNIIKWNQVDIPITQNEDGFVKIIELVKILNLTTNKLLKLTSYYKINVEKINNVLYITKEDFNFIKTLKSEIISKIINPEFLTLLIRLHENNI